MAKHRFLLFGFSFPLGLILVTLIWLYSTHDLVHWYFWPRQGASVAMWKGKRLNHYKSFSIEWSHGQTWNVKGERITLWHSPTLRWTNVNFDDLKGF